ncbi:Rhodanese-like protein [Lasiodiplodia theobromae]|uniref:Putative cysteine synthase n=1 Tax=Lasiodiplodia theobromae TaxID=45133 RepID=A0A5N5D9L9_9PEZI|nr:Rhodanese-like protein [Lasiodiplodia theobromae]KAB2574468.1 putative cysteine synthase [Lasiodiplodia theobromae]KAF4536951.1 Rhodanese-like protein [Lasiodiplodia theobromae]
MNQLNVYSGEDSLKKYYDPDYQPPLPLVEIPACLNPYRKDGVRIYAKMMTVLPANNVKALPAMNLLEKSVEKDKTKTVVEYSSGSTVISMSLVGRVFYGIDDTRAYLSNKTSDAKLKLMQFFGLNLTLFGGPSQPEPLDERGGIQAARRKSEEDDSVVNPNQYENDANWKAHYKWTGPQILKQLPQISVLCAGMGTSGTMTGMGTYFKDAKPSVVRVGVCTAAGDRVPGPRSYALMSPVTFPWRDAIDTMEEVGSTESYTLSLALSREGLVCGPSSGFNLQGLYQFIEKRKAAGTLSELADESGEIHCVFLCCDLPYQYINEYFTKLDASNFHPINNQRLTAVDPYRYDEAWELQVSEALTRFYDVDSLLKSDNLPASVSPRASSIVIDLREPSDFAAWHLPGAVNAPLSTVTRGAPSPFFDSATLERQWRELEAFFSAQVERCSFASQEATDDDEEDGKTPLRDRRALVVCYNGDTARVATSVLRAKGVEAESIKGGAAAVAEWWPKEVQKQQAAAASAAAGCFEKDKAAVEVVRVLTA